jgi:anti-sigma factor RsiW
MSQAGTGPEQGGCGHDAAAYVLGALDPGEVQVFRRHLEGCAVCREEVAALGAVVQALPMAAPQLAVNRALRRRVLADVRSAKRTAAREARERRRRPRARPASMRIALAGAAVLAVVAAIVAGVGLFSEGSGRGRLVRASVTWPSASAVVRLQGRRVELIVRRMPAPPAGDVYEVWLKRAGGAPIATLALFGVTSSGAADVGVPGDLRGVREVLVTPERVGGSLRPTHAPVIVARIA